MASPRASRECALPQISLIPNALNLYRGGMIAPLLGGTLITIDNSVPLYTSAVVFVLASVCILALREDDGEGRNKSDYVWVEQQAS